MLGIGIGVPFLKGGGGGAPTSSVVTDGLILYLDSAVPASYSGSGVDWFDLSSQGNDATLINGVPFVSADGGYFDFDGVSDYAEVLGGIGSLTDAISFNAWIKPNGVAASQVVLNYGLGSGARNVYLLITSGNVFWGINNTAAGLIDTPITDAQWVNVCGTYDRTLPSNPQKLYVNGSLAAQGSYASSLNYNSPPQLRISRRVDGGSATSYAGDGSQYLVYNRALSAADVLQNFNSTKDRYGL